MEKELNDYFSQEYYGGKSKAARIIDLVIGRVLIFFAAAVTLWFMHKGIAGSIVLACTFTLVVTVLQTVIRKYRIMVFAEREKKKLIRRCATEKLTLLDKEAYNGTVARFAADHWNRDDFIPLLGGYFSKSGNVYCCAPRNHPKSSLDVSQVQQTYLRTRRLTSARIVMIALAPPDTAAQDLAKKVDIELMPPDDLIDYPELAPSEEELAETVRIKKESAKLSFSGVFLSKGNIRIYLAASLVLMVWFLVFRSSVVYPIIAVCMILLAAAAYAAAHRRERA